MIKTATRMVQANSPKNVYLLIDFLVDCQCLADTHHEAHDVIEVYVLTQKYIMATFRGYKIKFFENTD